MAYIYRDELLKKISSIYKLVIIAARRAVELSEGAQKLVETVVGEKATQTALREIIEGKVSLKIKEVK